MQIDHKYASEAGAEQLTWTSICLSELTSHWWQECWSCFNSISHWNFLTFISPGSNMSRFGNFLQNKEEREGRGYYCESLSVILNHLGFAPLSSQMKLKTEPRGEAGSQNWFAAVRLVIVWWYPLLFCPTSLSVWVWLISIWSESGYIL